MPSVAMRQVLDRLRTDDAFRQAVRDAPAATLAGYALADEERDALMLPNFGWLIDGALAGSSRPRNDDALDLLRRHGVRAVLSLSEAPLPVEALAARGMVAEHLPIADFTAPTTAQIAEAMAALDRFRTEGRPAVVHCAGGLGRTGTILACALVNDGAPAEGAIRRLREPRPGSIETPEQEAAVQAWARRSGPGQDAGGA